MQPVSRDEFYQAVNALTRDVQPRITNDRWPYTSIWEFHKESGRPVFGKSVGRRDCGHDYFLADGYRPKRAALASAKEG